MPRAIVPDANVLISDVLRFTSTGVPTRLSILLQLDSRVVDVYVPRSVISEVHDHLPEVASRKGSPEQALELFGTHYEPFLRVATGGTTATEVEAQLMHRDADDVPLLRLAVSLNAVLLSKDRDLLDGGAAVDDWLPIVAGLAVVAGAEGTAGFVVDLAIALPTRVQVVLAIALLILLLAPFAPAERVRHAARGLAKNLLTEYVESTRLADANRARLRLGLRF